MRPRKYLSFSQLTTFEMSPEKYADRYLYGKKQRISRNMQYGSQFAQGLEDGEATGDPILDLMASKLPKYALMDRPVEDPKGEEVFFERDQKTVRVPVLPDKKERIPLLAVPDSATPYYSSFFEYKTSTRKWTQRRADESGQITFYALAIWLKTGRIPTEIELVNVPVEYDENGRLQPTGELVRLPTKRTMVDLIRMSARIKKVWKEINSYCDKELL